MKRRVPDYILSALFILAYAALSLQPAPAQEPEPIVRVSGTRFMLGNREIVVEGINYFPAYYPPLYPHSWLSAAHYDSAAVERELAVIQRLGFNLVAIQTFTAGRIPSTKDCEDLNDFLRRAGRHNLLVDLYIGAGGLVPVSDPAELAAVPRACGLAGNPAIFAYDIAWEPHFGTAPRRAALEYRWRSWLETSYGSIANASRAFGGSYVMPSDAELCSDRASVRVSAYKRFLDDTLSENYKDIRFAIRAVDSTHLIGARSGYGGNGSQSACPLALVDLRAASKYLDFVSPEAYALDPTDKSRFMSRGEFTTAYADVGKPILWTEFGVNVDGSCPYCNPQVQASFFRDMWALVKHGKSNGAVAWWLVGVRPQAVGDGERSDYGILYDYMKYPTAVDGEGEHTRSGTLDLCVRNSYAMRLVSTHRSSATAKTNCYGGLSPEGSFLSSFNGETRVGRRSNSGIGRWKELCSTDREALLIVTRNDVTGERHTCPLRYKAAGSFKPAEGSGGLSQGVAIDAQGQALTSGWLTLCVRGNSAMLKLVFDTMSQQKQSCPTDFRAAGSFSPEDEPVYRPAALGVRGALSGASAANRTYSSWITVSRDNYSGDWMMYQDGTQRYAIATEGNHPVGVRTPCFDTTSKQQRLCVGNQPFTQPCPALCLDAAWNSIEILDPTGRWQVVRDGDTVFVAANKPVHARFSAGNIGESEWLTTAAAAGVTGSVRFGCNENAGDIGCRVTIHRDVLTGFDAESGDAVISNGIARKTRVTFQMLSENVAWFGERISVVIVPK